MITFLHIYPLFKDYKISIWKIWHMQMHWIHKSIEGLLNQTSQFYKILCIVNGRQWVDSTTVKTSKNKDNKFCLNLSDFFSLTLLILLIHFSAAIRYASSLPYDTLFSIQLVKVLPEFAIFESPFLCQQFIFTKFKNYLRVMMTS